MRRFRDIIEDIKAPSVQDLWLTGGKLKYFSSNGWTDLGGTSDLSGYATKEDLNDYLSLTGGEITGTLGVYNLALTNASLGALVQLIGNQSQFSINTLNAGVNTFLFNIQNSTPLKLTSAGAYITGNIYENNIALEDKYVLLTDIATTGAAGLMSAADKSKLDNIASNANNYTLPNASTSVRGGVLMATAVADLAGTEDAATICTKVNALLAALRAAGILQS